jgi:class 3 adenylate cyclase
VRGFSDEDASKIREAGMRFLEGWDGRVSVADAAKPDFESIEAQKIAVLIPFRVDSEMIGLLGLGCKLTETPFDPRDRELIEILGRNLALALRNVRSLKTIQQLNQDLTRQNTRMDGVLEDLDRKVYHLKTLFDVSKKIFGSISVSEILRRFLLLTVGSFGAYKGFVFLVEPPFTEVSHFESFGYIDETVVARKDVLLKALLNWFEHKNAAPEPSAFIQKKDQLMIELGLPFFVENGYIGMLGLGSKLTGGEYDQGDRELLSTLVNNLVPALENARAFERIQNLNRNLQEANRQLKTTLKSLRSALRKVEILEGIKINLSKFVPVAVTRMIESSPASDKFAARERDVSVLFLDIEGYTRICEQLPPAEANQLIEKYFSVFMDAIYENHGDVNETAGDGLMVLFLGEDQTENALDAVKTAFSIKEKTSAIGKEIESLQDSVLVNMGISSGSAYVGAVKFESYTGSRWTYTSRGMTTNLAARICDQATHGQILVSKETATRIADHFPCRPLGHFVLKNITEEIEIFSVEAD